MVRKMKISHFAPTGPSETSPANKNRPNQSNLTRLYPNPKTYEQKKQDEKLLQKSYRHQWPKYPYLNISTYGSTIFGLIIWFSQNIKTWWFGNGDFGLVMSTVFFSFAIWLIVAFSFIAWINYVNKQFSYFGGMTRLFWLIYIILIALLLTLWQSGWIWGYTNTLWVPVLAILHFIVMLLSARRILTKMP